MEKAIQVQSSVKTPKIDLTIKVRKEFKNSYDYLTMVQGTQYVIVPIHTIEEKTKFDELLDKQTWMSKTKNKKM
jgi:hypothetical protein